MSLDGSVVYGAAGDQVFGWNYTTGVQSYNSGSIGSPDGTGVIGGSNPFSDDIMANGNDGDV